MFFECVFVWYKFEIVWWSTVVLCLERKKRGARENNSDHLTKVGAKRISRRVKKATYKNIDPAMDSALNAK